MNRIISILASYEDLLGLELTVHDLTYFFCDAEGERLLSQNYYRHMAPVCALHHTKRCLEECQHFANQHSGEIKKTWIHDCWKGVREVVVPILFESRHVATLFAGPFKGDPAKMIQRLPREVIQEQLQLPDWETDKQVSFELVFESLSKALVHEMESFERPLVHPRLQEILNYLYDHFREPIGVEDLAKSMHLSSSRCIHLIKELSGKSFKQLLNEERVRQAKIRLVTSSDTLENVATDCGFKNQFYFNTVFTKYEGVSPGKYRRQKLDQA
ncbi:MAG: helix-turn-helix domain-containing protein [Lentisphaeria bacterium]|nr:helix-turn-helix domain-containing protein [Lentisphaeria bacterium]